ncbi:MAG TPA: hypothetical protein VFP14_09755 [Novosphingobium sp.]|nr:hypothetical protein [Novosphingobium sp.]
MDDRDFYERRMREELARADSESDVKLKRLHSEWAGLYAERLAKLSDQLGLAA